MDSDTHNGAEPSMMLTTSVFSQNVCCEAVLKLLFVDLNLDLTADVLDLKLKSQTQLYFC